VVRSGWVFECAPRGTREQPINNGARKVEANALVVAPEAGRQFRKYIAPDALERYEARLEESREALRVEMLRQLAARKMTSGR
jgi:hypothetical protein